MKKVKQMKKIFKGVVTSLLVFIMMISSVDAVNVIAAEDTTAPELISVEVEPSSIKAGQDVKVKVKIKEAGTGLVKAFVQLNNSKDGDVMAYEDFNFETPLYSSKNKYIEKVFVIHTKENSAKGDWYLGCLDLTDQKGNTARYWGSADNNNILLNGEIALTEKIHINVTANKGDTTRPKINSISIQTPTVEKPGNLKIKLNLSEKKEIFNAQISISKADKSYVQVLDNYKSTDGNGNYIIEIPIDSKIHNGEWEVDDIYIYDEAGNEIHYTSRTCMGYLENMEGFYKEKFDLLKFNIVGTAGDETKPVIKSVKVLNEGALVSKPGILEVEVEVVEDGEGIDQIDIVYEIPVDVEDTVLFESVENSLSGCYFAVKGKELYFEDTPTIILDKPLKTGKHILEVPVNSVRPNGEYIVYVANAKDGADNEYRDQSRAPRSFFTLVDEYEYAFEMGIGNPGLRDAVKALKDGEVGRIMLGKESSENILPKQVLNDIAGRDKTLVCYRDGYQWIFRGLDIEPSKTKDLNLTTRTFTIDGENLSSGKKAVGISFENNGELPGKVEFRFKTAFVKNFFGNEEALKLYHVENSEGGYETDIDYQETDYEQIPPKKANIQVVLEEKDAWCYVDLTHNSKYVLSDSKITKLSKNPTSSKPSSNNGTTNSDITSSADQTDTNQDSSTESGLSIEENDSSLNADKPQISEPKPKKNYDAVIVIVVLLILLLAVAAGVFVLIKKGINPIKIITEYFSKK